jgi:hypothetical protein
MFHHDKAGAPRFDAAIADTDTFEIGPKQYSVKQAVKAGWYTWADGKLILTADGEAAGAPPTL